MSLQTRLSDLITAIGADIRTHRNSIGTLTSLTTAAKTSLVAAVNELDAEVGVLTSLTTTAKSTLVAAINEVNAKPAGSGSDPWTYETRTTAYTNSTVTASDVFTGFAPLANSLYMVEATLSNFSAAATTGAQYALAAPTTGITAGTAKISQWIATGTADRMSSVQVNVFTASVDNSTAPSLVHLWALIETGATVGAGNVRIQARSEIAGSAITVRPASNMRWRKL